MTSHSANTTPPAIRAALDQMEREARAEARLTAARHEQTMRNTPALAACYAAMMEVPCEREIAEEHGITLEAFLRHFAPESLVVPILVGKERLIAGAMWFKDGEVHLAVLRKWRGGRWVSHLEALFAPGFGRFGPVLIARVNKRNLVARRFTERIGGRRIGDDDLALTYELRRENMRYWPGAKS